MIVPLSTTMLRSLFLITFVFASVALAVGPKYNPHWYRVVESGTIIAQDATGYTFKEPSGKVTHEDLKALNVTFPDSNVQTAAQYGGSGFTLFRTTYTVPTGSGPHYNANEGNSSFNFFSSISDQAGDINFGGVLAYDNIVPGWSLAASFVGNGNKTFTNPIKVDTGDVVQCLIVFSLDIDVYWYRNGQLVAHLHIHISITFPFAIAGVGLGADNINSCDQYPPAGALSAYDLTLQTKSGGKVTPNWSPVVYENSCAARTVVNSPSKVTLTWIP